MAPEVAETLQVLLGGRERPAVRDVLDQLRAFCRARGFSCPSRAAVYNFIARAKVSTFRMAELPRHVQETLFNLAPDADVPGDQLAFHCFNYGGTAAMSFAAGLPWRCLSMAQRKRGWRPKSLGVLDAVVRTRGI